MCVCRHQDGGRGSVEGHQNQTICTMVARLRLTDRTSCAQDTPRASVAVHRSHLCPFRGAVKLRTNEDSRTRKVASRASTNFPLHPLGSCVGQLSLGRVTSNDLSWSRHPDGWVTSYGLEGPRRPAATLPRVRDVSPANSPDI